MIFRGIIEEVIDPYSVRVRIPLLHRTSTSPEATLTSALPIASVSLLPNTHINLTVGDIVIVSFENNDVGKPIILGYLYKQSWGNTALTKLSSNTYIGDITPDDLMHIHGLSGNIQKQLDSMRERIELLESKLQ